VEAVPQEIRIYATDDDHEPWSEWMETLEGQEIHGIIMNRIDRLEDGNFGDCHHVGKGVSELRIDVGPGYRVYFGRVGNDMVVLLSGGPKGTRKSQNADIKRAQEYWRAFNAEQNP
jgi:putative addiction module killer protein